jgi:hypothetical protein
VLGSRRGTAAPLLATPAAAFAAAAPAAAQDDGMDLIRLSPSPGAEHQQHQQRAGHMRTLSDQLSLTDSLADEMGYQDCGKQ